jgi:hypothetical protein
MKAKLPLIKIFDTYLVPVFEFTVVGTLVLHSVVG